MEEMTIDQEAEQLLRGAAADLTQPRERECLTCFVVRMLDPARLPDCERVRLGSTQPCGQWQRRRRGW